MSFVCKNGHVIDYQTTRTKPCRICVKEKNKKYREQNPEVFKIRRLNMTEAQKQAERERNKIYKAKVRAEGRRDYAKENADRMGFTKEVYLEWKSRLSAVLSKRREQRLEKIRLSNIYKEQCLAMNEEHIKLYKKTDEYQRRKQFKYYYKDRDKHLLKAKSKKERLVPSVIANRLGFKVKEIPSQLIELKRSLLLVKRELKNELNRIGG